jgi:hypothetical protein
MDGVGTAWELQGIFDSDTKAIIACRDESYFVSPITINKELPHETITMSCCLYPLRVDAE